MKSKSCESSCKGDMPWQGEGGQRGEVGEEKDFHSVGNEGMKAEGGLCYPSLDICVNYPLSTVTKFEHNVKAMNLGK